MLDMISKIELEDAAKNYRKVTKRVLEVALIVGNISGEITDQAHIRNSHWRVDRWNVNFIKPLQEYSDQRMTSCQVTLSCALNAAREDNELVSKYSDKFEEYEDQGNPRVVRLITFPYEYLYTEGWEDACRAHHQTIKEAVRQHKIETVEEQIRIYQTNISKLKTTLEELNA